MTGRTMIRVCANCVEELTLLPVTWRGKTVYACDACRKILNFCHRDGISPGMGKAPRPRPSGIGCQATKAAPTLDELDMEDEEL